MWINFIPTKPSPLNAHLDYKPRIATYKSWFVLKPNFPLPFRRFSTFRNFPFINFKLDFAIVRCTNKSGCFLLPFRQFETSCQAQVPKRLMPVNIVVLHIFNFASREYKVVGLLRKLFVLLVGESVVQLWQNCN